MAPCHAGIRESAAVMLSRKAPGRRDGAGRRWQTGHPSAAEGNGMATVDLLFPVVGARLPTDHGYVLYGALSRTLPCLHDDSVPFGMAPVTGQYVGNGLIQLD